MAQWQHIAQTTTTPATLDDPFIVTVPCPHRDQALEVAAWIVEEIQTNVESDDAQRIKQQNAYSWLEAIERWQREGESLNIVQRLAREVTRPNFMQIEMQLKAAALGRWALLVRPGGVWDHKQYFDPRVNPERGRQFATLGITTEPYHHKYQGYEYYYDIWSNIHYGYVGRYIGFSEDSLLDGAGLAQYLDDFRKFGRSPTDRSDINGEGVRRFDDVTDYLSVHLGISLYERFTPQQLTGSLLMNEITQVEYPEEKGSKIPHTCQGVRRRLEEVKLKNSQGAAQ
ncbi:polymorphic toxin type 44 domain-containing protein [Halomonas alkaliantarctica]|uniref:polymorphic toxin type 44 domain-containing protein n=1 Tax=Halomonas alkaliantarctica TaxID=232346 RepID=UPI0004AA9193|nr:polymorphic toxin type 44 domain-containing protein [Halomonas alkaliantarctica]